MNPNQNPILIIKTRTLISILTLNDHFSPLTHVYNNAIYVDGYGSDKIQI